MGSREAFVRMYWLIARGLRLESLSGPDRLEYLDELEVFVLHAPHGALRVRAIQLLNEYRPASLVVA
jgi:hypothetical protein